MSGKKFLVLFGASSILGVTFFATAAPNTGCAAQGCAQIFGVVGTASTKYGAMAALMTSPTLTVAGGWAAGPNGLTTLTQGGIPHYIEAGPTKDCYRGLSCSTIHPYSSYSNISGTNFDEIVDKTVTFSSSATYHTFGIRYVGSSNWQGYWCDTVCHTFLPSALGQGAGFPYAASGGETSSKSIGFGSIASQNHTVNFAGSTVANPFCYGFTVINNAPGGSISSCGTSQSWTVQYNGSVLSAQRSNKFLSRPKSWYHASEAELRKFALELLHNQFRVSSDTTPRVLLVKRLKNEELESLGITPDSSLEDDFPVALIILKAKVDASVGIAGINKFWPAKYIGYVIELESGSIRTMGSRTGGRFKKALKDDSIPDDEDTLSPAIQRMVKEKEKFPEAKTVPLPFPEAPKRTCKICVQGL